MPFEALPGAASKHALAGSADRLLAVSELPPVEDLQTWVERLLRCVGEFLSNIWAFVVDFVPRVPGYLLDGFKVAGLWLIHAPLRLFEWLSRALDSCPFLLDLAKWIAIALGVFVVLSLGIHAYHQCRPRTKKSILPGPNGGCPLDYGTCNNGQSQRDGWQRANIRGTYQTRGSPNAVTRNANAGQEWDVFNAADVIVAYRLPTETTRQNDQK
ncbi:hypothetical protein PG995_015403 [Apiospora arundinis]